METKVREGDRSTTLNAIRSQMYRDWKWKSELITLIRAR